MNPESRGRLRRMIRWHVVVLSIYLGAAIGHRLVFGEGRGWAELWGAAMLLTLNAGMFVMIASLRRPQFGLDPLVLSMALLVSQLFVNTFTIFFLIGLQAVDPAVFVPVFFGGYFVLLGANVVLIHLESLRGERQRK